MPAGLKAEALQTNATGLAFVTRQNLPVHSTLRSTNWLVLVAPGDLTGHDKALLTQAGSTAALLACVPSLRCLSSIDVSWNLSSCSWSRWCGSEQLSCAYCRSAQRVLEEGQPVGR